MMIAEKIRGASVAIMEMAHQVRPEVWERLRLSVAELHDAADCAQALEEHKPVAVAVPGLTVLDYMRDNGRPNLDRVAELLSDMAELLRGEAEAGPALTLLSGSKAAEADHG